MAEIIHDNLETHSRKNVSVGVIISIFASFLIGMSFIIKKYGLAHAEKKGRRASDGGFGYLKDPVWWIGMLFMSTGEILNFVAYMFAPAVIIAPIGAISILTSILLGVLVLKENFRKAQGFGCILIVIGTTILLFISPEIDDMYVLYVFFVFVSVSTLIRLVNTARYSRSLIPYILICSILCTLTISSCKGISVLISHARFEQIYSDDWRLFFIFSIQLIVSIIIQIIYLNKVLDIHSSVKVTPVYYTFFTLFVTAFNSLMYPNTTGKTASFVWGTIIALILTNVGVFITQRYSGSDATVRA
ncbi:hypothetical protein MXB_1014 [Myxobolus squamalis]|nr:hypothetical protein MXB_1014 [Myxobolus squamalis]